MVVNLHNDGVSLFLELCKKDAVSEFDIDLLLKNDSYSKAIELMGSNWGIGLYDEWKKIFKAVFWRNEENLNKIQIQYINHIINAKDDYEKLINLSNRINNIIKSEEFVHIAKEYAFIDGLDSVDVYLLIFGPNAGGNQAIIIDVFFLEQFSDEEITRILAHELHHIIRSKHEVRYEVEPKYEDVLQMVYWFESEGIANLCNFEETSKLYEMFGYIEKDSMVHNLNNIDVIMKEINQLIIDLYQNNKSELYQYLFENFKFHSIGYHMALTIFYFSQYALKSIVGDPLKFINLYQVVCEFNELKFSEESMKIINQILTEN